MTFELDLRRVAVVLMDIQNDIVHPEGAFGPDPAIRGWTSSAVTNASRLAAWARGRGVPVNHVAAQFRRGHPEIDERVPLLRAVKSEDALVAGSWGAQFHDLVAPRGDECVFLKTGIDAFANNDLVKILRKGQRDTLLLAGVQTNAVVLATAFCAVDYGFVGVIVSDACAGGSESAHHSALALASIVASNVVTDDIVAMR